MTRISDDWRYFCDVKKQHAQNNIDERAHGLVKKISIDGYGREAKKSAVRM